MRQLLKEDFRDREVFIPERIHLLVATAVFAIPAALGALLGFYQVEFTGLEDLLSEHVLLASEAFSYLIMFGGAYYLIERKGRHISDALKFGVALAAINLVNVLATAAYLYTTISIIGPVSLEGVISMSAAGTAVYVMTGFFDRRSYIRASAATGLATVLALTSLHAYSSYLPEQLGFNSALNSVIMASILSVLVIGSSLSRLHEVSDLQKDYFASYLTGGLAIVYIAVGLLSGYISAFTDPVSGQLAYELSFWNVFGLVILLSAMLFYTATKMSEYREFR